MLVLSRRLNEKIVLPTVNATIQVVALKSGVVRIGIEGPEDLTIFRAEIFDPEAWKEDPRRQENDLEEMTRRLLHQLRNRVNSASLAATLIQQMHQRGLYEEMATAISRLQQEMERIRESLDQPQSLPQAEAPPDYKPEVLVVEDDANECELLAGVLRLAGLQVNTANDGADALEHLKNNPCPDFVLMDLMMPRCDGLTAARTIRENPAYDGLKIFAVTGMNQDHLSLSGESQLIDRWFSKPLNPERLLQEMASPLDMAN